MNSVSFSMFPNSIQISKYNISDVQIESSGNSITYFGERKNCIPTWIASEVINVELHLSNYIVDKLSKFKEGNNTDRRALYKL